MEKVTLNDLINDPLSMKVVGIEYGGSRAKLSEALEVSTGPMGVKNMVITVQNETRDLVLELGFQEKDAKEAVISADGICQLKGRDIGVFRMV